MLKMYPCLKEDQSGKNVLYRTKSPKFDSFIQKKPQVSTENVSQIPQNFSYRKIVSQGRYPNL